MGIKVYDTSDNVVAELTESSYDIDRCDLKVILLHATTLVAVAQLL